MIIEDQVVSLELAKRLKKDGFKQESLFYWATAQGRKAILVMENKHMYGDGEISAKTTKHYSAYTASELGEYLPFLTTALKSIDTRWSYFNQMPDYPTKVRQENFKYYTEAESRARMLIYLKENNLL